MTIWSGVLLSPGRARDLFHMVSLGLLCVLWRWTVTFRHQHTLGTPGGTTIVNMDNDAILKVNLEDLLDDDQRELIGKAVEEFHEKCLLSYSRMSESVVQKTPLLSVLLQGQSEEAEARATAH